MSVAAVIVHYGEPEVTQRALTAVTVGSTRPEHVILVDNGGPDDGGSGAGTSSVFEAATETIRPGSNVGFAAGANLGARAAIARGAEWVWFLNNDARPAHDCLENLLAAGLQYPDAGLLSPVILRAEDGAVWYAGGEVEIPSYRVRHVIASADDSRPYSTGYVTGCAALARTKALRVVGLFDERLFMYAEDVDLSLRMRERHWRSLVVPSAKVSHSVAMRGGRRVFSPLSVYYQARNRVLLAKARSGLRSALPPVTWWVARQTAKAVAWGDGWSVGRAGAAGVWDGLLGRAGPASEHLSSRVP
jgi:GT2 family glycosyltransferase